MAQVTADFIDRFSTAVRRTAPNRNTHYATLRPQPIDVMRSWMSTEQFVGFCLGNCVKYAGRFNSTVPHKGGIRSLEKMRDYIEWAIDALYAESSKAHRGEDA